MTKLPFNLILLGDPASGKGTQAAMLVKKYGFYEGGGSVNPWRIDPVKLVALLTGKTPCSIQQAIGQPCTTL